MQRGEIWWAALPRPKGSAAGLRRPVLVVQSDAYNASRIQTVVVAAITSNLALERAPGNVLLRRRATKLPNDSVVNVSQLVTLEKSLLDECVGTIDSRHMNAVAEGLKLVLAL